MSIQPMLAILLQEQTIDYIMHWLALDSVKNVVLSCCVDLSAHQGTIFMERFGEDSKHV